MAIKRGSKVEVGFSASSMTDLIFLLLLFMMLSTTLINPNAVKLTLPKSSNQIKDKAATSVSITADLTYYLETRSLSTSWRRLCRRVCKGRKTRSSRCIPTRRSRSERSSR